MLSVVVEYIRYEKKMKKRKNQIPRIEMIDGYKICTLQRFFSRSGLRSKRKYLCLLGKKMGNRYITLPRCHYSQLLQTQL